MCVFERVHLTANLIERQYNPAGGEHAATELIER